MRDRGTKDRVLNLRHFWCFTALISAATAVQALLLWYSQSYLLVTLMLDVYIVRNMLQNLDVTLAQHLTSKGLDLTDPNYLRYLVAATGPRYGEKHIEAMQFLLQHRTESGHFLADYYLPEKKRRSYKPYRFNNPLAIAIERGNLQVIKFLESAGFRCDDEVLAASISTTHPEGNLLEYRLKVTNEPVLTRPLAFELLVGNLSKLRADRYIRMGIDLTETDAEGNNIFHFLSESSIVRDNSEYVLKQALEAGCDINADNMAKKKLLWLAVEKNRVDSFKLLLKLGANREITSPDGMTIRDYCEKRGYATLLVLLN